jgi:hypothetical protein
VGLDLPHQAVQLLCELDALRTENEFVEVLSMTGPHHESRINVLIDEYVVEDRHVWDSPTPLVALEHRGLSATHAVDDHVGRILGREPVTLGHGKRVTCCQRSQDRGESRLASSVLGIDDSKGFQWQIGARRNRVEQPDVAEHLQPLDH